MDTKRLGTIDQYPELINQWDYTKNSDDPSKVTAGTTKPQHWVCSLGPDHKWLLAPNKRTWHGYVSNCPFCEGKRVSVTNSLKNCFPAIAAEWHLEKNIPLTPDLVVSSSNKSVHWKCLRKGHEWTTSIDNRTLKKSECPKCIPIGQSLLELRPDIAEEWDFSRNSLLPEEVSAHSHLKSYWRCKWCGNSWAAVISGRTAKIQRDCPKCSFVVHSKAERYLRFELSQFFCLLPEEERLKIDGKNYYADIIIPELSLLVEYDGCYWHRNKQQLDYKKSMVFIGAGWKVIRVRESSKQFKMDKLTPNDVVAKPNDYKNTTNAVVMKIIEICGLDLTKFSSYLKEKELLKKNDADEYIDAHKRLVKNKKQNTQKV